MTEVKKLECPEDIPVKVGLTFHCYLTTADGEHERIGVSIENDKGAYSWAVD